MLSWDDLNHQRSGNSGLLKLWALHKFIRPYRLVLLFGILSLIVGSGAILAFGAVLRILVDSGFNSSDPQALYQALTLLLFIVLVMSIAAGFRIYLVAWLGERVVADVRHSVFSNIIGLDRSFFEKTPVGEIISRLTADTVLIQTIVGFTLAVALRNSLLIIGGIILMIWASPLLSTILIGGLPLVAAVVWILARRIRKLSRCTQDALALMGSRIDETLYAVETVQSCVQEKQETKRFANHVETAFQMATQRAATGAWLATSVIFLIFSFISAILWIGGLAVFDDRMTAGELAAFLFYAIVVAGAITAMSEVISELMRGAGATERLFELLLARPAIQDPEKPRPWPETSALTLRFDNLHFSYPSRKTTPSVKNIDIQIEPGSSVALVGPSGAGKSTLFHLLLRFHDPDQGKITLNGINIRELDLAELRSRVVLVPQDPVLFSGTIRDNIVYARPEASETDILEAARCAHVLEFTDRLPDGMRTELGERGIRLSGGERARVALARALIRNPKILLLDEATSSLDAESEYLIQDALEAIRPNRTILTIAHRLATVRSADSIIVMQEGEIITQGTHAQLLSENGLYSHLCKLQFQEKAG